MGRTCGKNECCKIGKESEQEAIEGDPECDCKTVLKQIWKEWEKNG